MLNAPVQPLIQSNRQYSFYCSSISAGFPSPADDYIEQQLDLNDLLIKHPVATFFLRANGHAMLHAGIHDQDILIIDRSLPLRSGCIVIAVIDGQLTVRQLKKTARKIYLLCGDDELSIMEIKPENDIHLWGVVTHVIHPV